MNTREHTSYEKTDKETDLVTESGSGSWQPEQFIAQGRDGLRVQARRVTTGRHQKCHDICQTEEPLHHRSYILNPL